MASEGSRFYLTAMSLSGVTRQHMLNRTEVASISLSTKMLGKPYPMIRLVINSDISNQCYDKLAW